MIRIAIVMALTLALAACGKGGSTAADGADMSLGDPNAKVKVIEYASLSCPHCARFNSDVFPQFKAKYIDTGKVHYTFREFLTQPVSIAAAGALLARCSGKDKFFPVVDAVFRGQQEMATQSPRSVLLRIGQSSGMTEEQFDKCVGDEDALKALAKRTDDYARKEKITATPTFIINGERIEGEATMADFDRIISPMLAK